MRKEKGHLSPQRGKALILLAGKKEKKHERGKKLLPIFGEEKRERGSPNMISGEGGGKKKPGKKRTLILSREGKDLHEEKRKNL